MITFKHIEIGYQTTLLHSEEILLESGNVYALIGRNGIGKSTLIQTMVGVIPALSGTIFIQEQAIAMLSAKEISEKIALVETRFEGIAFLKVKDYLALGRAPFTDVFGRMKSEDWEAVYSVAEALGISHLLEKYTDQISDGERQLCAVGRAFVQETPIILMDEPTAFLDYINRNKLLEMLVSLAAKKDKCIILSTHDIDVCLDHSVPMLFASSGKIQLFSTLSKSEILNRMNGKRPEQAF